MVRMCIREVRLTLVSYTQLILGVCGLFFVPFEVVYIICSLPTLALCMKVKVKAHALCVCVHLYIQYRRNWKGSKQDCTPKTTHSISLRKIAHPGEF